MTPGENRWLQASEFHPNPPRAVHHASFLVDTTGTARMLQASSPEAGYEGMGDIGFNLAGSLGAWSPGASAFAMPCQTAMALPASGDLVIEMHISPTGKSEEIGGEVGIYFSRQPPQSGSTVLTLGSLCIDIPAGKSDYELVDKLTLPVAVNLYGLLPHAHFVCQQIQITATRPDGAQQNLLRIDDWDFNFLQPLMYRQAIQLPAGTQLRARYVFDNSAGNPQNPHNPPRRVFLGDTARDEMAMTILYVSPENPLDLETLADSQRAKQIERMNQARIFRAQHKPAPPAPATAK
jgi:hypothetical protein